MISSTFVYRGYTALLRIDRSLLGVLVSLLSVNMSLLCVNMSLYRSLLNSKRGAKMASAPTRHGQTCLRPILRQLDTQKRPIMRRLDTQKRPINTQQKIIAILAPRVSHETRSNLCMCRLTGHFSVKRHINTQKRHINTQKRSIRNIRVCAVSQGTLVPFKETCKETY